MSKKQQTSKNIDLTFKLMSFIVKDKKIQNLPQNVSYIPFSSTDEDLNTANEKLLESVYKEDKPVVIAEEPKSKTGSWKITPVNF